jgi:phage/plasmid-like protein (TIGR03299 family)
MSHDLEQNVTADGSVVTSFAAARKPGWHGLGTVVPSEMTVEEGMRTAHLGGWNVTAVTRTERIMLSNGTELDMPTDDRTVVRTNPFTGKLERLGSVGSWYQPIQNEDHATYLQTLVGEGGATLDTLGSLDGGRRVFVTAKLPNGIKVGGVDPVDLYVACLNSHDGTSSFTTVITPVRVVCANTERAALGNNRGIFKVRHTERSSQQIVEARKHLGMTAEWFEEFGTATERMINTPTSVPQFRVLAKQLIRPEGEQGLSDLAKKNDAKMLDHLTALFEQTDGNGVGGTRWAAYNAFTEHYDWHARVQTRGGDADAPRAQRALVGGKDDEKAAAFKKFLPAAKKLASV